MKGVRGDLSVMPLPDIMQWAELNRKSGTLTIRYRGKMKRFYLREGKIVFVSSEKRGERLGEFLLENGYIGEARMKEAIRESQRLGVPFTGYLISEGIMERETLEQAIERLAEVILTEALGWEGGEFVFSSAMPPAILNGPIMLNTSFVLLQAVKLCDESGSARTPDAAGMARRIAVRIREGDVDLPPIPEVVHKLNEHMQRNDSSVQEIVKTIMSDQTLTSKILKVVNSAYYGAPGEVTSLQQAIIYLGLKSILSIVTVHALSNICSGDAGRVRAVLRHSLLCAFIAKRLAPASGIDPEEAFVCGLLHDMGKTAFVSLAVDRELPEEVYERVLQELHPEIGFVLASRWNLPEVVKETVRFHHRPEEAMFHSSVVKAVHLADAIANSLERSGGIHLDREGLVAGSHEIDQLLGDLDEMMRTTEALL